MAAKHPETQIHLRPDVNVVAGIDKYIAKLETATPGVQFSRSDAAMTLIIQALAANGIETKGKKS